MRNMLQLLGGVAVAGAVAAGSTAFTASGLSKSGFTDIIGGGSLSINVNGARVTKANLVTDPSDPTHITGVALTIDGGVGITLSNANTTVQVTLTGTATGTPVVTCGAGVAAVWTCTAATPASNYYTDLSAVAVVVAPVV